jgi:hypothetical protein
VDRLLGLARDDRAADQAWVSEARNRLATAARTTDRAINSIISAAGV